MKRSIYRWVAYLQIGLVLSTGCHPTQPFFIGEDGDLSHYLDTAMQIEYPDIKIDPLPEASQAVEPLTVDNQNYEIIDLSLEDCISYALNNTKLVRSLPGSNQQTGDIVAAILSSPTQQLRTAYDPAITASSANPQPAVIDQNGNRTLPRGAARASQVGGVEAALAEFDAQYSSFIALNTTDRPRNNLVNPLNPQGNVFTPPFFTGRDATYQSALSKRIATGGVVSARAATIYSQNSIEAPSIARFVPSDWTQTLEIQLQHPLMRNRGTMVNRIPAVLARINEDISLLQYEESVRNAIKEVEVAYWDLYCAYWQMETARTARDIAQKVWRVTSDRFAEGQVQLYAKAQAEAQLHQFQAALEVAWGGANVPGFDTGVTSKERKLRMLMGWAPTDGRLIRPSDKPMIARVDFDWADIQGEAIERNVDLRQQRWVVKQRELELISAKNQILPEVNLSTLYRWLGVGDQWMTSNKNLPPFPEPGSEGAGAWNGLTSGDYQEAALRLEFVPNAIGARNAHALIRAAQLSIAREHTVLEEKEVAAVSKLSDELGFMKTHFELMQLKLNQWAAEESGAEVWLRKFEIGDTSLDIILDNLLRAQERKARAQAEYYRAVCEYNKSIVMVHLVKGSLLEYNSVAMQEGPWPDKAMWDANERARERDAAKFLKGGASRPQVISQGPYIQNQGTANDPAMRSQVSPMTNVQGAPSQNGRKMDSTNPGPAAEEIPAVPNNGPKANSNGPVERQSLLEGNVKISKAPASKAMNDTEWSPRNGNRQAGTMTLSDASSGVQQASSRQSGSNPPLNNLRN